MASLKVVIGADTKGLKAGFAEAKKEVVVFSRDAMGLMQSQTKMVKVDTEGATTTLQKFQQGALDLGKTLREAGEKMTRGFTVPILGAAAAAFMFSDQAKADFTRFGAQVRESMASVGTDIARTINLRALLDSLADTVKGLTQTFISLPEPVKVFIVMGAGLLAALGPVVLIIGKIISAVAFLIPFLSGPVGIAIALGVAAVAGTAFLVGMKNQQSGAAQFTSEIDKQIDALRRRREELEKQNAEKAAAAGPKSYGIGFSMAGSVPTDNTTKANKAEIDAINIRESYLKSIGEKEQESARIQNEAMESVMAEQQKMSRASQARKELFGPASVEDLKRDLSGLEAQYVKLREAGVAEGQDSAAMLSTTAAIYEKKRQIFEAEVATENQASRAIDEQNAKLMAQQSQLYTLGSSWDVFLLKLYQIPALSVEIGNGIFQIFQQLTQGIGNVAAQILVYGQSAQKMIKQLFASVLSTVISTFVQIALQQIIAAIAAKAFAAAVGASNIGVSVARAGAAAYAAAIESEGLYGLATGPGFAAEAIAGATMAAAAGKIAGAGVGLSAGAAGGGIFDAPSIIAVSELRKPEVVMNEQNMRRVFPSYFSGRGGRGGVIHAHFHLDGREAAEALVPYIGDALGAAGAA
jgi:hypothetical protein